MTLDEIKLKIWHHKKVNKSEVKLHTEADRHKIQLPINDVTTAQKFLDLINERKVKKKVDVPKWIIERYNKAHYDYTAIKYPNWEKDGHYFPHDFPDVGTSNGLTNFVCEYLLWSGHFANRTGNEGRVIMKEGKATRIHSSSKKGMQDIDCNLTHPQHQFGIPWKVEIKVGADRLSEKQIEYGKEVARTGAVYSVVSDPEDFFAQLDKLLILQPIQTKLL